MVDPCVSMAGDKDDSRQTTAAFAAMLACEKRLGLQAQVCTARSSRKRIR